MPKLAPHEIGDLADLPCALSGCNKRRRNSGLNGYELPFCLEHLTALPKRTYVTLDRLASTSVYDHAGVAEACREYDRQHAAWVAAGSPRGPLTRFVEGPTTVDGRFTTASGAWVRGGWAGDWRWFEAAANPEPPAP